MQSQYVDKQYAMPLSQKAIQDLNIFFFENFFKNTSKILDVGCSVGRIMEVIGKNRVTGFDADSLALKIARKKGFKVVTGNLVKTLPFKDSSFEGIFCSQVIEHLSNPLMAIREMKRVLTKGGRLVLITPDYLINHRKHKNGFWSDYTHKTPFTKESLERIAYDSGFKKYRVYHLPGKIWRNIIRTRIISKEQWIRLDNTFLVWRSQDMVLEAVKD